MSKLSALPLVSSLFALVISVAGCARPPAPPAEQAAAPTEKRASATEAADALNRAKFQQLMTAGASALADRSYDLALSAYSDALALYPADIDAAKGLAEARKGREALAGEKQDSERKLFEISRLLSQAKEALAAKRYAEAVRVLEQARLQSPSDETVAKTLVEARELLAADQGEKKKLADYDASITAGQTALRAGRPADALREFNAALRLVPGDAVAQTGVREAEKLLDSLQDKEKRRAEYLAFMAQGGAALKNKKYEDAVSAFSQALKLYPDDSDAQRGLSDAKKATSTDTQTEYLRLLKLAEAAMRAQRLADAQQAYAAALQLVPNDAAAMQGMAQAQQALAAMAAAQAAYTSFMQAGAAAFQLKRYGEARRAFSDALKIVPNDPAALVGYRDASYGHHMAEGGAALAAGNFARAVREFETALVDIPNDPAAIAALKQARASLAAQQADYNKHLTAGNTAFAQKKYADAVKEYEAALRAVPNDPTALAALQQAKALLKKK